jgi:hypothetical protein
VPITRVLTSSILPLTIICPRCMIATDVQNSCISVRMCEEIRIALPAAAWARMTFFRSIRPCGSTPEAGSSRIRICGSGIKVLASISRCRIPRESSTMNDSYFSESPTTSISRCIATGRAARGMP